MTSSPASPSFASRRSRKRFPKRGRPVRVRFLGSAVLSPRSAKTAAVRTR